MMNHTYREEKSTLHWLQIKIYQLWSQKRQRKTLLDHQFTIRLDKSCLQRVKLKLFGGARCVTRKYMKIIVIFEKRNLYYFLFLYYYQGGYAKGSGKYEYEAESKSKSASKSGAAVVPVCLPLCCAMPCSIM